jgi:hypothetical protein
VRNLFALTAALLALPLSAAPAPGSGASLALTPCQLEQPLRLLSLSAQCGELAVPEDRSKPDGRQIKLFVARVPALNRETRNEPVFLIAGGPGMGTVDFYTSVSAAFNTISRDRDLVLVDQRGTGRSAALLCKENDESLWSTGKSQVLQAMTRCREGLAAKADLAQYTTSVAVADLDAVRSALGYARINLYGSSYGTRVAQHYARRHPASTRALILDGVVAPQTVLGPAMALDAQAALDRILARCREDAQCRERFGDPAADYQALRTRLAHAPVQISVPDPVSGAPVQLPFSSDALAVVLRLSAYSASQAALLPLALHMAVHDQQYTPLGSLFMMSASSVGNAMAYGMHNSVVCAEDIPRFDAKLDRKPLEATFMGTQQVELLQALCEGWPRGPVDADLYTPLKGELPVLLLSGSADPVTPPAQAKLAALQLPHAVQRVLPDQGHGQLLAPCMNTVMAEFLRLAAVAPAVRQLDVSCLEAVRPAPFMLGPSGPGP